jgi:hypothetical protein
VLDGDVLVEDLSAEEALARSGSVEVTEGRLAGTRRLPVAALLEGRPHAAKVELWPCSGPVWTETSEALRAEPLRYALVLTRGRGFKLVDTTRPGPPLLRTLAAVRIVR